MGGSYTYPLCVVYNKRTVFVPSVPPEKGSASLPPPQPYTNHWANMPRQWIFFSQFGQNLNRFSERYAILLRIYDLGYHKPLVDLAHCKDRGSSNFCSALHNRLNKTPKILPLSDRFQRSA